MGSGKKKQPSYQASNATIAPAIAVVEAVPKVVSPVASGTVFSADAQPQDLETAILAGPAEQEEVVLAESLSQDADASVAEPKTESIFLATSPAPGELVTPVTDEFAAEVLAAGAPGKPMLLGGADVEDMTAEVIGYAAGDGHRFVLHTKVRQEAEEKLLDALSATEPKTTLVEKQVQAQGRLPLDTDKGLYEQLAKVAKSVNHHIGEGSVIPHHTAEAMAKLETELTDLSQKLAITSQDTEMLAAYAQALDLVQKAAGTKTTSAWIPPYE